MIWGIAAAVLILLFLIACYLVYKLAFYNDLPQDDPYRIPEIDQYQVHAQAIHEAIRQMEETPYERVVIKSFDGLNLSGRYYHMTENAPLQIQMHGYRGNPLRDLCGGFALARKMGQNVLVVDQRGHGLSGGHVITFGVKERMDCLSWIEYSNQRFGEDTPIILTGVSMGAATVLMALDRKLPSNVSGVIGDCPFSCPVDIIRKVCADMKLSRFPVRFFASAAALLFGHFNLSESSAEEAVKNSGIPILLIHGNEDRFVPCEMSRKIREANPEMVTIELFPGAGHGLSCMVDPERYETLVKEFIKRCVK